MRKLKKSIWKSLGIAILVSLAIPGFLSLLKFKTINTIPLVACLGFIMVMLLIYEYQKLYWYNKRLKDLLPNIKKDRHNDYSYTDLEGRTTFYLSASDVIELIESDSIGNTVERLEKLYKAYSTSPKLKYYLGKRIMTRK